MSLRVLILSLAIALGMGCNKSVQTPLAGVADQQSYTSTDVSNALDDAEKYAREGQYEKALERHIWYHNNALKFAPAHQGVRLSFALMYWTELGEKYPKALDALREVRDAALEKYRQDPKDAMQFGEVMSIDFALKDYAGAKAHYYEGKKNGMSDEELSLRIEEIVDLGEISWARDIIGDPDATLKALADRRQLLQAALPASSTKARIAVHDNVFKAQCVQLIRALVKTHDNEVARRIQSKALKILNSSKIREAL